MGDESLDHQALVPTLSVAAVKNNQVGPCAEGFRMEEVRLGPRRECSLVQNGHTLAQRIVNRQDALGGCEEFHGNARNG